MEKLAIIKSEKSIIDLKELSDNQKKIIKHINNMIIEQQQIFKIQPEELLISSKDYNILAEDINYKYLLLGKIKIYKV